MNVLLLALITDHLAVFFADGVVTLSEKRKTTFLKISLEISKVFSFYQVDSCENII